ncbi:MAG: rRNA maturation RNase YbeY [Pirellulaceae bacterium]
MRKVWFNRQTDFEFDETLFSATLESMLDRFEFDACEISIAVLGDSEIHELNRQFLQHDYPTDVLTFPDDRTTESCLYGEIVVSSDTAQTNASELGVDPVGELLLYVVHGVLHLVGLDDHDPAKRMEMRKQEQLFLEGAGFQYRYCATSDQEQP